jgi:hypothetical protein
MKKGKYIYYYCTNSKGKCPQHLSYIKEQEMDDLVKGMLKKFVPDKKLIELSLKRYLFSRKQKHLDDLKNSSSVQDQIKIIEKQQKKLEVMYLSDRISPERYDERLTSLKNERVNLEISLKTLKSSSSSNILELLPKFKDEVISLKEVFENGNFEAKSSLLKSLLWNCEISDKKIVTTRYKDPYNYLLKFQQTDDLLKLSDLWNQVVTLFQIENPIVVFNSDVVRSSNQGICYEIRTLV